MQFLQQLDKHLSRLTVPLGRWVGVPVFLHWSWVILFAVIVLLKWEMALVLAALFFIVLLHECGHCIAGRYFGCYIRDIVLYPFGGAAAMVIPEKPKHELVIAIAGPLVNVLLILPLWLLAGLHQILATIALYNVVLLVFNLIPAFPMDGGRVLRSLLLMVIKNRLTATLIATRIGQGFAALFVVGGIALGAIALAVVGVFVFLAAEKELAYVRQRHNFLVETSGSDDVAESAGMMRRMQERMDRLHRRGGGEV